jgi:hypothetical protein
VVSRRKGKIVVSETFRDSRAFSVCGFVVSDTNAFVLTDTNTIVMTDTKTDGWFSLNSVCGSGTPLEHILKKCGSLDMEMCEVN